MSARAPWLRLAFGLAGAALLGWLLVQADLGAVASRVAIFGLVGFLLVNAIFAVEFAFDCASWQLILFRSARSARWLVRLYRVRLVGEAINVLTPLGGMGGEPVKALLLKQRYGLGLTESTASLVLAKTTNVLALVVFLAVGFVLMLDDARVGVDLRVLAGSGLAALALGIGGFVLVQRLRVTSRIAGRVANRGARLAAAHGVLARLDDRLVDFYTRHRSAAVAAAALALLNWVLGAVVVMVTLHLMGHTISFADAWVIESLVQMVRAAAFLIPAGIGAQEGALVLVVGALSGDAGLGLALAAVRRARELAWVVAGSLLGARDLAPLRRDAAAHEPRPNSESAS